MKYQFSLCAALTTTSIFNTSCRTANQNSSIKNNTVANQSNLVFDSSNLDSQLYLDEMPEMCYTGSPGDVKSSLAKHMESSSSLLNKDQGIQAIRYRSDKTIDKPSWFFETTDDDTARQGWIDMNPHETGLWMNYDTNSDVVLILSDLGPQGDGTEIYATEIPPCQTSTTTVPQTAPTQANSSEDYVCERKKEHKSFGGSVKRATISAMNSEWFQVRFYDSVNNQSMSAACQKYARKSKCFAQNDQTGMYTVPQFSIWSMNIGKPQFSMTAVKLGGRVTDNDALKITCLWRQ